MTPTTLLDLAERHHLPAVVEFSPGHTEGQPRGYVVRIGESEGRGIRLDEAILAAVGAMMARTAQLEDEAATNVRSE